MQKHYLSFQVNVIILVYLLLPMAKAKFCHDKLRWALLPAILQLNFQLQLPLRLRLLLQLQLLFQFQLMHCRKYLV